MLVFLLHALYHPIISSLLSDNILSSLMMIFSRYDIIVDATDNAPSRYMISDCCVVLGKVI